MSDRQTPTNPRPDRSTARLVLLAIGLLIAYGLAFGGGYGESIDEPSHARFGRQILKVYLGQRSAEDTAVDPLQHGPFYSFVAYVAGGWVEAVRPGWLPPDGRHFVYYLSFIMATVFVGVLVGRYARTSVAWLTSGLFFTQPLLFGHAFINPKDIPFMAFFLASITLAILVVPKSSTRPPSGPDGVAIRAPKPDRAKQIRVVRLLLVWSALAGMILIGLWFWGGLLPFLEAVLSDAYHGQAAWPIQRLFTAVATDAYKTPFDLYVSKLAAAFEVVRVGTSMVIVTGTLYAWGMVGKRQLVVAGAKWGDYLLVSGAGVMLGLDTSIRSVAPYAAIPLVFLYLRYTESRRKALTYSLLLAFTSILACLLSWPFLWQDTISRYVQSVLTLSHFPWQGLILFNGRILTEGQQPWYFVPELMLLQFTLPVIVLAVLGVVTSRKLLPSSQPRVEVGVLLAIFLLPVLASLRPGTVIYNNFRQLLFTVPAFFVLAGLGIEQLFRWLKDQRWRYALAIVSILPGVVGIVRLRPYEYMYYNALAGIGGDVYSRFESDYWCTSYSKAMAWVNAEAPKGATVEVGGSGVIGQTFEYARSDLQLVRIGEVPSNGESDYVVICDGKGGRLSMLPGARTLIRIEKAGVTLAEVKIRNSP